MKRGLFDPSRGFDVVQRAGKKGGANTRFKLKFNRLPPSQVVWLEVVVR